LKFFIAPLFIILLAFPAVGQAKVNGTKDVNPPTISHVRFDDKSYFPGDIIASTVKITATLSDDASGVGSIEVGIGDKILYPGSPMLSYDTASGDLIVMIAEKERLAPGQHTVTIKVWDIAGNRATQAFSDLKVLPGFPKLSALFISPMAFRPGEGQKALISYNLSMDTPLSVLLYSEASGDQISDIQIKGGSFGGREGLNNISWDGTDSNGKYVDKGLYHIKIISGNKVLGSAKVMVED